MDTVSEKSSVPAEGKSLCGKCLKARFIFAIFAALGIMIIYGCRTNLHVGIVSMVNHTYSKQHSSGGGKAKEICKFKGTNEKSEDGPFKWNPSEVGYILSSYFLGYCVIQIPAGRVSEKISGKWVFFASTAVSILGCLITPIVSRLHYGVVVAVRIIMGLGGASSLPAMHVLISHWCPKTETSIMSAFIYAGIPIGTVVYMLTSGLIAHYISWEAIYYIQGGASMLWLPCWIFLVSENPEKQRFITEEEREYILDNRGAARHLKDSQKAKVPWKAVWTCRAFWALLLAHLCMDFGWNAFLSYLPQFMKSVLAFPLRQMTVYTSIPYLFMWLFGMANSYVLDTLRKKEKISTTTARKISVGVQAAIPLICLHIICLWPCNRMMSVILMNLAVMAYGGMYAGVLINHVDLAANFAGTLLGITNTIATVPGVLIPIAMGQLLERSSTMGPWYVIFYSIIGLLYLEIIIFSLFGSGVEEPFNKVDQS